MRRLLTTIAFFLFAVLGAVFLISDSDRFPKWLIALMFFNAGMNMVLATMPTCKATWPHDRIG